MPKLRLLCATTLSLALAGCHSSRSSAIRFTIIPHPNSVDITCTASSTGKCHFAFDIQPTPTVATVEAGSTTTFQQVSMGTQYCGEVHAVSLDTCKKSPVAPKRENVEKKSSDDRPVSN
jgi:uncharacterized membrane protein